MERRKRRRKMERWKRRWKMDRRKSYFSQVNTRKVTSIRRESLFP